MLTVPLGMEHDDKIGALHLPETMVGQTARGPIAMIMTLTVTSFFTRTL
jgi:hypothetical protein